MSDRTLTPDEALTYLAELSTDIRAAAVLDADGELAAQSGFDDDAAEQAGDLVRNLLERTAEALPEAAQVEVSLPEGVVYAVRERGWTLAAVTGRFALSSLMFYDLRMVIRDLGGGGAARA